MTCAVKCALFQTHDGSDTEESDSEQPLSEAGQVVAILNAKASTPPPLPVSPKHANATASAVLTCLKAVPETKRTVAHDHALRTPISSPTIADWVEKQLDDRRTEATLRNAMTLALNPNKSASWVAAKAKNPGSNLGSAKGMALHLRCHPFTRSDVQRGMGMIGDLCLHRERRNNARLLLRPHTARGKDVLDVAVVLVGFQYQARRFGAYRYRYVM